MNFKRSEFACKCGCGFDTVDAGLLQALNKIRDHFEVPITITSGCRCIHHNNTVGGATTSQHLIGRAGDFTVQGVLPDEVYAYVNEWHTGGLGYYQDFTHIDSRNIKTRW